MNNLKRIITNIMVTTGTALMLLAVFAVAIDGKSVKLNTFFEIFAANIVIHLGFILTKKIESTYAILENIIDISYLITVLVAFGFIFDWFSSVPVWYLIVMAFVIYAFGVFVNIARTKKDADILNKLLQKHKEKKINIVTYSQRE